MGSVCSPFALHKAPVHPKERGSPRQGWGNGSALEPRQFLLSLQIVADAPGVPVCVRAAGRARAVNVPPATTPASTAEG